MKKIGWMIVGLLLLAACTSHDNNAIVEPGVSLQLATQRANDISDVSYNLQFTIPAEMQ